MPLWKDKGEKTKKKTEKNLRENEKGNSNTTPKKSKKPTNENCWFDSPKNFFPKITDIFLRNKAKIYWFQLEHSSF